MTNLVWASLIVISCILAYGTIYSVYYSTYLDTSNPLLTHLPHKLHQTHYFASKSNFLNVIFIKQAWAWTSGAFAFLFLTSPSETRTKRRIIKYVIVTAAWLGFTSWFFGPALLERFIVASGGECVLVVPQSGDVLSVPVEYCYTKSTVSPSTHPNLFTMLTDSNILSSTWNARPRLRRGHDVSGHVFLLTMSALFLSDQLIASAASASSWSALHKAAIFTNVALIAIWMFAMYTTALYFHSPAEKVTGYLLGVAGFAVTQLSVLNSRSMTSEKQKVHQH